ncbi:MAG: TIGR03960 family B12-binding radical SAM protein [Ruminococcus sp.]|nr:TIGR03960 family B12-binding radical SAM protein [Ruminococcus sp.]
MRKINILSKIEPLLLQVQKPAQYIGGELGSVYKNKEEVDVRFAFCFPDTYEIGMSHLGMKILYSLKNACKNFWCERVFAPDTDFEILMRKNNIPLFALESLEPVAEFDIIGFTLQYELSYTNILNMLDLAGIPVFAGDRDDKLSPIIVAGGPCVCNPEPLADFFDLFILGEGEEVNIELMNLYAEMKKKNSTKKQFLKEASKIQGIYVPSFYDVSYKDDGTISSVTPKEEAPAIIKKRIISDFDNVFYPDTFIVPYTDIVHDRAVTEVLRGCIRGCRFCQAGFIYRPFREKSADTVCQQSKNLCENTGYDELSLSSLSTSDHSEIDPMLTKLLTYTENSKIHLSLPSLRVDNFSESLMEKIKSVRKGGLTFAPEAGTQRLRDVINKNVTENEIRNTVQIAFSGGYFNVKLYFMMGLPTETDEDIAGIAHLADEIVNMYFQSANRPKGKMVQVSISVATFVPKPFTPFQWEPQATEEEVNHKQEHLLASIQPRNAKRIKVSWHDFKISQLEAVLARGDRKLGKVIYEAWKNGAKFDSWSDRFKWEYWKKAFLDTNISPEFYASRKRELSEILPWDHLDYYISKAFLKRELNRAEQAKTTSNCRQACSGCGVNKSVGRECF